LRPWCIAHLSIRWMALITSATHFRSVAIL
jgi:hypothetical protein